MDRGSGGPGYVLFVGFNDLLFAAGFGNDRKVTSLRALTSSGAVIANVEVVLLPPPPGTPD